MSHSKPRPRLRWLPPAVALLALTLSLAACGDDNSNVAGPTFTVDPPAQISPAEGAVFNIFPRTTTLVWVGVPRASEYRVEVDTCLPTCADRIVSTRRLTTDEPTVTFDFSGAQPGRWRVRAKARWGTEGEWSNWRGFKYLR